MKEIKLTQEQVALVDDEDYERVISMKWHASLRRGTYYAGHSLPRGKDLQMHRFILGISDPKILIDHSNRNTLDNRRENLRICSPMQNQANKSVSKDSQSGFKGVRIVNNKYYCAYIGIGRNKSKHLGSFRSPIDAAVAYDNAARVRYGEFARTNFSAPNEIPFEQIHQ